ncbi:efflux RND transporter permease subunit [Colwellia sp. MB02u-6]|uniref:efflux RND transporter permease subunit n=1 Tax=Colwellia sp. MB02u-6 TaxID=2759824 RepID=UPI0015F60025|nr:efflux RND transporter permease subunit [Colwellia sp. MB02u-6]MBA6328745.1 efflux RND transporter permease subunit [Colwellia sp. MB02u-6]
MQLPRIAIKNAQFTFTIIVLMVLVGIVSYFHMPRSEDPQFDIPIILLEIIYPGASPTDIETLVVDPLEEEFSDIEGIKKIESQIKNGGARIYITFLYGSDPNTAYNEIKQAVSTVKPSLPEGVQDVLVLKATPTSVAIIQLALWSEITDYKSMEFHAKQLEKRLEAIEAVKKADIWGYPTQVVAVDLNLAMLKHYGISMLTINSLLQKRAINITPGFVDANTRRFNVKTSGNFQHIDELNNTVVFSNDTSVIRLKDVASVGFSSREPSYLAYYDSKPVIFLTVEQRSNTNIFALTEAIDEEILAFKQTLPDTIKTAMLFKQSDGVENRVNGFFDNLWQGLVLVGLMSLIFLGLREAIVVLIAIPLSFLIAIGWLDFAGFGLQQMSIVGLIIALGLLVDNAIVVTESIHQEKKNAATLAQASAIGTSKVGWAITSGTVTTMLAFLPMLMLASDTGDFVRSMPVTVVLVLLASLLIALTLTPLLASKFFSQKPSKVKALQHYVNIFAERYYVGWLGRLMNIKLIMLVLAFVALLAMASLFGQVGVSLFPKAEKAMLLIDVETPANSSLDYTNDVMHSMTAFMKTQPYVDKVALNVGSSNPRIYYNEIPKRGVASYGQVLLVLKSYDETAVNTLVKVLRAEFSQWHQAKITVKEFTQGPVTDQPITIRLISESLSDLEEVASDLQSQMAAIEGVINLDNPIGIANTELVLAIDYDKAALSGIDINQLDNSIQTALSGTFIGQFNDVNGENYPILVRRPKSALTVLSDITIVNQQGESIPLGQFVEIKLHKGRTDFFHYQKLRMARVSADAAQGYSVQAITSEVVNYLDKYTLPVGMYYRLGGEEESRQESFSGLSQIMLITAIGIFAILVLQFKSFSQPLIIFTSIPFAMAGAVFGLYLTNLSFSMMAFIGLISLFGIVVNNAIILIDTTNRNLSTGLDKKQAILSASATRFTPILLTTITTIGGLLPLTLFGGSLWQPLGVVIISGLCVSAIASFIIVPILTELFTKTDFSRKIKA